jgi:hypothetical protein
MYTWIYFWVLHSVPLVCFYAGTILFYGRPKLKGRDNVITERIIRISNMGSHIFGDITLP